MRHDSRSSTVLVISALLALWSGVSWFDSSAGFAETLSGDASRQATPEHRTQLDDSSAKKLVEQPPSQRELDRSAMVQRIDELLEQRWNADGVKPAPVTSDSEFLRRAFLDLIGVTPRVSEVRAFLADERTDRRERLIETLLASPRYATHMATTWRNRLIPYGAEPQNPNLVIGLQNWLRAQFAKNRRFDGIVGDLLVATQGNEFGEALYFRTYDLAPEKLAASSAELFLGMQLQCAQCHDHPYGDWSQEDFWGYAAFFARVRDPDASQRGNTFRLIDVNSGEVMLPDSDQVIPPKYLGGRLADPSSGGTRRQQLAIWMVSQDNPYLKRAVVNWAWAHLFGMGLVEPVGDAGDHNPPSHPELLEELATYFAQTGFDTKELWRTLARTRAYQLSSQTQDSAQIAPDLFAKMAIKSLTPEQLYDSIARATLVSDRPAIGVGSDAMVEQAGGIMDPRRADFVRRMRSPTQSATEFSSGILQSLSLMNGPVTASVTDRDQGSLLAALDTRFMTEEDRVEALFLATLSRYPRADEQQVYTRFLKTAGDGTDRRKALSDLLWATLNSTEFAFNH